MKNALDPYMFRRVPLKELPGVVADLGYQYIESSAKACDWCSVAEYEGH
jgi:myo-inositol catabolism protein IolH